MGAVSTPAAPAGTALSARGADRWALPALIALLAAAGALLLYVGHGTGFAGDDWNFVLERRDWTADALLKPHNEHLSLVPVLVYKLLFATVGIGEYLPYRIVGTAFHLAVVALLFAYARPRVGPWLALACAALMVLFGPGYLDVVWPFQIGFLGSLAFGLGAFLALDRGTRRGDALASGLITASLFSSSLGIPLALAFAIEVLAVGRRWKLLIAPVVLYGLWYVAYGTGSGITGSNILATPRYVAEAAANASAALVGLDVNWGRTLILGFVVAAVLVLRRVAGVPWRVVALTAAPLAFWALTGLTRAQLNEPGAPRYLYPGALLVLLLAIELARGLRPGRGLLIAAAVLVPLIMVSDAGALRGGVRSLRSFHAALSGALTATEIAGNRLPADFLPAPGVAPQVHAGPYLAAVRDFGSAGWPRGELAGAPEAVRAGADDALVRGYGLAPAAAPATGGAGPAPTVEQATGATARPDGACVEVTAAQPANVVVTVPPGGLRATGATSIAVRRWADAFHDPAMTVQPAATVGVAIPRDDDPTPWHARVAVAGGGEPARICSF
jgi:hypothetical protein